MTRASDLFVPRTVTVVDGKQSRSVRLEEFRSAQTYVLLGDPGAGKTRAFHQEHKEDLLGEFVTARQFIRKSPARVAQWEGRTLFIDGLDEARAAGADPRRPLDLILERLDLLPNPRFRISCRSADWLGRNDLQEIVSEVGYGDVRVLHLEPLTDRDIQDILVDLGESDTHAFLDEARKQGLEGLLDNPQLLRLLVKATQDGKWPADRSGVLELACRKLAKERNDEHRAARRADPPVSGDRIVAAAGHLSAFLLMSDRDRVSLDASEDPTVISLEDVADGDQAALVKAVKSNLFVGRQDGFEVLHRLISEFLAARFLHDRIEKGVPAGRVLALMAGGDGVVVNELRGLAAWLAAFDRASRSRLVETDPVGVALYGDVSRFAGDDLEHLLGAFAGRPHEVQLSFWPAAALSSLVGNRSVALLLRYLGDDDRTLGRQTVAVLLLRALSSSLVPIHCRKAIENTVRDDTWHSGVRRSALHALCRHSGDDQTRIPVPLIVDLLEGKVADRDGELVEMLDWGIDGKILIGLLDTLVERGASFPEDILDKRGWAIRQLIQKAIRAHGEDVPISTLYNWLELIGLLRALDPQSKVTEWLKERPALLKTLANEVLRRSLHEGDGEMRCDRDRGSDATASRHQTEVALSAVFHCRPGDFGEWCLEQAVERAEASVEVARMLLECSLPWHDGDRDSGLALDDVRRSTEGVPVLRHKVDLLWEGQISSDARRRETMTGFEKKQEEYASERRRREDEFIAQVRRHADELREARCAPALLHNIAEAYHNWAEPAYGWTITPRLRVEKHLGGQEDLADAALEGFRSVVGREDLPTLRDVIRADEEGKISFFALPVLAGFDLMTPERIVSRSRTEIARAAALYYVAHHYYRASPDWYQRALKHHREAVAEALIKVTRSRVRKRRDCPYLRDLAQDESCRAVARMATLSLLRTFPTRCTEPQVSALRHVLAAGLKWNVEGIAEVVQRLAAKDSLDVAQRSQWLAAGLFLSPESYTPQIVRFLEDGEEARSRNMVRFLSSATRVMTVNDVDRLSKRWSTCTLRTMIEALGSRYSPWRPEGRERVQTVDANRESVEGLISQWATALASRTDRDAADALRSLADDPKLESWHLILADKRTQQVVARRSATFAVPDLDAVHKALADAQPANPADLAALVVDRLERLGREISCGNTDDWRQFWNEENEDLRRRHPTGPKHEESCRDALLSGLRHLLPAGVDAQPEARYARGKRSDIRISFGRHAVPVEVKKDSHPKLWSAVADQLGPRYASAPDSAGFGVYLVLWFDQGKRPVPPVGRLPKTPGALRDRLQDQLTGPHRHKISVIVLDVSGSVPGTS